VSKQINNLNKSLEEQLHLNKKQEKTDNNLKTNDKTIVGAINEIQNSYATAEYVDANLKMTSGDLTKLQTNNKTNLVGAINELFQNVDSGKQLIADAIDDDTITKDSTFAAMSDAISDIKDDLDSMKDDLDSMEEGINDLRDYLIDIGADIDSSCTIDELISFIQECGLTLQGVKQIVCCDCTTFLLYHDGTLYGTGKNSYGELGLGHTNIVRGFTKLSVEDVTQVECGLNHVLILKKDGSVLGSGRNNYGQLGKSTSSLSTTSTFISISTKVKQIACGDYFSYIMKSASEVYVAGFGAAGALGNGSTGNKTYFASITKNISDVKQIVCGGDSTYILKNDGSVWATGDNSYGQLGFGSTTQKMFFEKVTTNINNDVIKIAAGKHHVMILKKDKTVFTCGRNNYGQLGIGSTTNANTFTRVTSNVNNVKQIACGPYQSYIIKNGGSLHGCGDNSSYQLGISTMGGDSYKTTMTSSNYDSGESGVSVVCGGLAFMLYVTNKTTIKCWGAPDNGQNGSNITETGVLIVDSNANFI
jgi:alpha-tubulin suppressor-like RCC1 family protein